MTAPNFGADIVQVCSNRGLGDTSFIAAAAAARQLVLSHFRARWSADAPPECRSVIYYDGWRR